MAWAILVAGPLCSGPAWAGPPYATDDPEPVEYRHWEFYLGSQTLHDAEGWSGTLPHFEVNYGVVPNVQLHLLAPLAFAAPSDGAGAYGPGDTELGVKFRFLQESEVVPQAGTFPFVEVPTGSKTSGLGNGVAQLYVPLWIQKSFANWTTYGGGGYWFDVASHGKRWWYLGWLIQRRLFEQLALGLEVFHLTPRGAGTERDTRFNLGAVLDATDNHHVLISAGRGLSGPCRFQSYIAYQLTVGS